MKHQPHRREKKTLSMKGLLEVVREVFAEIPTVVQRRKIGLADCLMSALAMFSMKSPSLLAFDGPTLEEPVRHNLRTLYDVANPPSDTYMREALDEVEPRVLRRTFLSVFHETQRGKVLERYSFLGGYLCLVDGTEIFNSEKRASGWPSDISPSNAGSSVGPSRLSSSNSPVSRTHYKTRWGN